MADDPRVSRIDEQAAFLRDLAKRCDRVGSLASSECDYLLEIANAIHSETRQLKVRTKSTDDPREFDLYLGETFLGRYAHEVVTPLANAIVAAVNAGPVDTVKAASTGDHPGKSESPSGSAPLFDKTDALIEQLRAPFQRFDSIQFDRCRVLMLQAADALLTRSAIEPRDWSPGLQRWVKIMDYIDSMKKSAEEGELYGFADSCKRLRAMIVGSAEGETK